MQLKLTLLKMLVRTPYYCTYMHKTEGYFCSLCWLSNLPINVPGSIHTFSLEFSLVFQLCSETLPCEGPEHCFSVHIHPFPLSLLPLKPMTLPIWYEYSIDPHSGVEFFLLIKNLSLFSVRTWTQECKNMIWFLLPSLFYFLKTTKKKALFGENSKLCLT